MTRLAKAKDTLQELSEDSTVPRNIKERLKRALTALGENIEDPIKVDKALQELEEISEEVNLQSYIRTQIWQVASLLEKN